MRHDQACGCVPRSGSRGGLRSVGRGAVAAEGRVTGMVAAAPGEVAEPLVEAVVEDLRGRGLEVATGRFGAHMAIDMEADGPVTILVEAE